jgi:hypothetical protein
MYYEPITVRLIQWNPPVKSDVAMKTCTRQ